VGAPCFSRGKLDFSPAEKAAPKNGFSRGIQVEINAEPDRFPFLIASKAHPSVKVGAPCFSRGELDFSPAEMRVLVESALAAGLNLKLPRLRIHFRSQSRRRVQIFLSPLDQARFDRIHP